MHKPKKISWPIYIKFGLIKRSRFFVHAFYKIRLMFAGQVWKDIQAFKNKIKKYPHFGGNYSKYAKYYIIYKTVRKLKPNYVLECGCGISTIIISRALQENGRGVLVSMEQYESFGNVIAAMVDSSVQMRISDVIETQYNDIKGVRYSEIPDYAYDLVFVDGPTTKTVDLDAFYILEKNPTARILIDCRVSTIHALQTKYSGTYNTFTNMGHINF